MGIFTSMPTESPLTVANVRVVSVVPTSTTVQAWVVIATIVDDLVASFASKAYGTGASKTVDKVGANTSITTRIRAAFININVAIASGKTYMKERRKKIEYSSWSPEFALAAIATLLLVPRLPC